jgi:DNA-damage-inducible protein D
VDAFLAYRARDIPQTYADALIEAGNQAKRAELAESKVKELTPKADFADALTLTDGWHMVREAAKQLNIKGVGERGLFDWMYKLKWIYRSGDKWLPMQWTIEQRLLRVNTGTYESPSKEVKPYTKIMVATKALSRLRYEITDVTE